EERLEIAVIAFTEDGAPLQVDRVGSLPPLENVDPLSQDIDLRFGSGLVGTRLPGNDGARTGETAGGQRRCGRVVAGEPLKRQALLRAEVDGDGRRSRPLGSRNRSRSVSRLVLSGHGVDCHCLTPEMSNTRPRAKRTRPRPRPCPSWIERAARLPAGATPGW